MKEHKDGFNEEFWSSWLEDDELAYWQQKAKIHPYDTLTQHSLPGDPPHEDGTYLVKIEEGCDEEGCDEEWYEVADFVNGCFTVWPQDIVKYWWDLPKVRK